MAKVINKVSITQFQDQGKNLFGEDINAWTFVCPKCKAQQSNRHFLAIGIDGVKTGVLGYSCIRKFSGGCDCDLKSDSIFVEKAIIKGNSEVPIFKFKGEVM